jgi:hypothetical protein
MKLPKRPGKWNGLLAYLALAIFFWFCSTYTLFARDSKGDTSSVQEEQLDLANLNAAVKISKNDEKKKSNKLPAKGSASKTNDTTDKKKGAKKKGKKGKKQKIPKNVWNYTDHMILPSLVWLPNPNTTQVLEEADKYRNKKRVTRMGPVNATKIDRIYYINLKKNKLRRNSTEGWLSKQDIPWQRVNASIGINGSCLEIKSTSPQRCIGLSGLSMTQIDIIDNYNTTGVTMVVEDDFKVLYMDKIIEALRLVPPDWDILRFDCYGEVPLTFPWLNKYTFRTTHAQTLPYPCRTYAADDHCWFCGGTHVMLWQGHAVQKLRRGWSQQPYDDIDCVLFTMNSTIKSYCAMLGVGEFHRLKGEETDIMPREDGGNNFQSFDDESS